MSVNFYAVYNDNYIKILASLLEKTMSLQKDVHIVTSNKEESDFIDQKLWEEALWIPHTLIKSKDNILSSITIGTEQESSPISETYVFLINQAHLGNIEQYEKVFVIFNGNDNIILKANRNRWLLYKQANLTLNFYKQLENGKFEKQDI